MGEEATKLYEAKSILRYLNSPGKDLFQRTDRYQEMCNSGREDSLWSFQIMTLERKDNKALIQTKDGEQRWVIDAASNDYLGLSRHSEVIDGVIEAINMVFQPREHQCSMVILPYI